MSPDATWRPSPDRRAAAVAPVAVPLAISVLGGDDGPPQLLASPRQAPNDDPRLKQYGTD
jgi:hypothetical protein